MSRASVRSGPADKCKGELSNLVLEVDGTPPLKIKYSKLINQEDHAVQFQTLQPENFVSPLVRQSSSGALISSDSNDVAWARSQRVEVPLNETLTTVGGWLYSIDEVHDACGNIVNYTQRNEANERSTSRAAHLEQGFIVHERPRAVLEGCDPQNPLKIAEMESTVLPVRLKSAGQRETVDNPHTLSYVFTRNPSSSQMGSMRLMRVRRW
jgi:nucleoporin POM152